MIQIWTRSGFTVGIATLLLSTLPASNAVSVPIATGGPLVHTYSIVARDADTGQLGVAVQSHWFSVGSIVSFAEAGVGAVATQSLVEISYGPKGLDLMRGGLSAPEALKKLLAEDPDREVRQVAMVDANGAVAVHTGELCIAEAGDRSGEQFSVQANLMLNDRVWGEMAAAYSAAEGDLAERLLVALEAAQEAGGDVRGQQSASILIVGGERSDEPWRERVMDLRVEDNPDPVGELRRLVQLQRAYDLANQGDEFVAEKKFEEAMRAYAEATELASDNVELKFWKAASLFKEGHEEEALRVFGIVFDLEPHWVLVVPRLGGLDVLADSEAGYARAVEEILAVAPDDARSRGLAEWEKRRGP